MTITPEQGTQEQNDHDDEHGIVLCKHLQTLLYIGFRYIGLLQCFYPAVFYDGFFYIRKDVALKAMYK